MQDLEKILKETAGNQKIDSPAEAWPYIANALNKRKKRRAVWYFFLLFIIVSIGSTYLIISKNKYNTTAKNIEPRNVETININTGIKVENTKVDSIKKNAISKQKGKQLLDISNEEIFEKLKNKSKLKSNKRIKITNAQAEVEFSKHDFYDKKNNELATDSTSIEKFSKIEKKYLVQKNVLVELLKKDYDLNLLNKIAKKNIALSNNQKFINQEQKKWKGFISLSYNILYAKPYNLFENGNANKVLRNQLATTTTGGFASVGRDELIPIYQKGNEINLSYLQQNMVNKLQPQLGITLALGSFNNKAYAATSATISPATLVIDSTAAGNSNYATVASISKDAINLKSNYVKIGVLFGCNISLLKFKNAQKIVLQTHVIPTINLSQTINWYANGSNRFFTEKSVNNNFNVTQSFALLWQTNYHNKTILLGPNFNFNYFKLNKSINDLYNIYTNSFGIQIQMVLKK